MSTATTTFGPIGALHRSSVRTAAFRHGVDLHEDRSLLSSTFTARAAIAGCASSDADAA